MKKGKSLMFIFGVVAIAVVATLSFAAVRMVKIQEQKESSIEFTSRIELLSKVSLYHQLMGSSSDEAISPSPWWQDAEFTCVDNRLIGKELSRPLKSEDGEDEWRKKATYTLQLSLPSIPYVDKESSLLVVTYPDEVKAGEQGTIVAWVIADDWGGRAPMCYNFVAHTDLYITSGVGGSPAGSISLAPDRGLNIEITMQARGKRHKSQSETESQNRVETITGTGGALNVVFLNDVL